MQLLLRYVYLFAFLGLSLSQSNLIYRDVAVYFWGFYPVAGKMYLIFLLMFFSLFSHAVYLLFSKLNLPHNPLKKKQIQYLLWAFFIGSFGLIDYVIKYRIHVYPFGYLCAFLFILIIAHTITKHYLLDIKVVISRTVAYLTTISIFSLVYFSIFFSFSRLQQINLTLLLISGIFLFFVLKTFRLVRIYLQTATDKSFIKAFYDYRKLQRRVAVGLKEAFENEDIEKVIFPILADEIDIKEVVIYFFSEDRNQFVSHQSKQTIALDDPIIKRLQQKKSLLRLNNKEMADFEVLIPSFAEENLVLIVAIGKKRSEDPYTEKDFDLFRTISEEVSMVLTRIKLYAKVVETQKQLFQREREASIGRLAAVLAHEIKNPLTAINGMVQAARNAFAHKDYEFFDEFSELVPREVLRIRELLDKLLVYSRPKSRHLEKLDITDIVDRILRLSVAEFQENKITIKREFETPLPLKEVDGSQLTQVFTNLIKNAIQAMPDGGQLLVKVYKKADGRELKELEQIVVEITDTGLGIAPEKIGKIFEPFFTGKKDGTGLGLAISQKIIREHDGKIEVVSHLNKGTSFVITL